MHAPLRIELADEAQAEGLCRHLQPFNVETVRVDGHVEARIAVTSFNPERKVVAALNAVEAWLLTSGVSAVRVHLDGSSYVLHAPPRAGEAS